MNKAQLVDHIAGKVKGVTKKSVAEVLEAFMDGVMMTVKKGDAVTLTGFGTFKLVKRKARKGRNPRTGEDMTIKATNAVKFSVGKAFKTMVK